MLGYGRSRAACSATWTSRPGSGGSPAAADPDDPRRCADRDCLAVRGGTRTSADRRFPPERLLRALLLRAFYSVRSERLLMEQLDYNLLYRWFVGLGIDDPVWHPTAFTTNRDRLLAGDVAAKFLAAVLRHPRVRQLLEP